MTTTQLTTFPDGPARARQALAPLTAAVALAGSVLSWTFADSRGEALSEVAFILVLTALVFGLVVPRGLRHGSAGGRGICMGVIALVTAPLAFWSGIPLVLGAAAALLGYAGRRADSGATKAIIAFVLGLLAVIGYFGIYLGDYVNTHF